MAVESGIVVDSAERVERSDDETPYLVPGLLRGIRILQMFGGGRETISPPEMAQQLKLPRTTVYRLVQTLEHLGLLERIDGGSAFRPGLAILGLGFEYLMSLDMSTLGRPVLEELSAETGLASHLVLRDGPDVVVIQKGQGRSPFASSLQIGTRLPAHATVLGRMTLIGLSEAELAAIFGGGPLKAYNSQTPRSVKDLAALLAADRERGYAVSDSFFESGISAIAAPVLNGSGRPAGAINVTLAGPPTPGPELDARIALTVSAARRLSRTLGMHPAAAVQKLRSAG